MTCQPDPWVRHDGTNALAQPGPSSLIRTSEFAVRDGTIARRRHYGVTPLSPRRRFRLCMRFWSASRLADIWEEVRNSYWLLPALMVLGAIGLAIAMSYVDVILPQVPHDQAGWVTDLRAGAARTILSTLAGSMATIVGIVFSITIVALQLASSQFGPHVLRSFLHDRGSQASLGALLGSFTYSLLMIAVVRGRGGFVPYASTYTGILIGLLAIGMLIYFINHIAKMIRVESVIAALADQVTRATEQVFPNRLGEDEQAEREAAPTLPDCFASSAREIVAADSGYIRRLDDSTLIHMAQQHDLLIRLDVRPGDFIVPGALLMAAAPAERVDAATGQRLREAVLLGYQRTPEQDLGFALQHLEEVAIRALSSAINAPFSAIPAIDQIGAGLSWLAARRMPSPYRRDADGKLRILVMRPANLADIVRETLGPIASTARAQAGIMVHLIEVALLVANRTAAETDRVALEAFAAALVEEALAAAGSERERAMIRAAANRSGVRAANEGRIA